MMSIKDKKNYLIIGLILLSIYFLWFHIRPSVIARECSTELHPETVYDWRDLTKPEIRNRRIFLYEKCLHSKGLE